MSDEEITKDSWKEFTADALRRFPQASLRPPGGAREEIAFEPQDSQPLGLGSGTNHTETPISEFLSCFPTQGS